MATSSETENRETQSAGIDTASSKPLDPGDCCGGPAPKGADACCVLDAQAKSAGTAGCGCASQDQFRTAARGSCC